MKPFKLFSLSLILIFLASCSNSKHTVANAYFQETPPFIIDTSYFQHWVAGTQMRGKGTKIHLAFQELNKSVEFKTAFFRGNNAPLLKSGNDPNTFVANIKVGAKRNIIMDEEPLNEAQNTPPLVLPFQVNDTDAVFSYLHDGKLYYYIIENVTEREAIAYPSQNPNGDN